MQYAKPVFAVVLLLLCTAVCWSQSKPCLDATATPVESDSHGVAAGVTKTADRLMSGRPTQTVDADKQVCPLTAGQKFHVFIKDSYSPVNMVAAAFSAAIWQATQSSKEGYGQGWRAYGSRFGAALADSESGDFFQEFLFPAILHQDPRYFRLRDGPVIRRGFYAVTRVLVAHGDNGHHQFNFSELMGGFAAAGVSNAYYPSDQRDASDVVYRAGLGFATDAGWNLLREFGPDISRAFHRHKKQEKKDMGQFQNVPRP